jgi:hypothetical protein
LTSATWWLVSVFALDFDFFGALVALAEFGSFEVVLGNCCADALVIERKKQKSRAQTIFISFSFELRIANHWKTPDHSRQPCGEADSLDRSCL